jgi:hypothetical protein
LFSKAPPLKDSLYSMGRQAVSVLGALSRTEHAQSQREAQLYTQLGAVNHKLIELEAAHLALQAKLQRSRADRARSQDRNGERMAALQQQIEDLASQRDRALRRVRQLELSLGEAESREARLKTRFDALCAGLECDRTALQTELSRAQDALASSREEVQQLRTQGSRVLQAMRRAQRLADQSGSAAHELDTHLTEHRSRLLNSRPEGPRGQGDERCHGACDSVAGTAAGGLLASRQLRLAAGLPVLLGALLGARALWFTGDNSVLFAGTGQQAQQAGTYQADAQPAGAADTRIGPAAEQARAALASMQTASRGAALRAEFDAGVQRHQRDLLALGFDLGSSRADGVMGALTEQALNQFALLYLPGSGLHALSGDGRLGDFVSRVAQRAREDGERLNIDSEVLAAIQLSHMRTGVALSYLAELAAVESRFDPTSRSTSSTAAGLYQFTGDTWMRVTKAHGDKYGLSEYVAQIDYVRRAAGGQRLLVRDPGWRQRLLDLRYDARIAALMAAEFASDNRRELSAALGREITSTDLYLAHFLGAADAIVFLALLDGMPDREAGSLFPVAADANGAVFYPPGGRPRTLAEIYALFERKFNTGRYQRWDLAVMLAEAGE